MIPQCSAWGRPRPQRRSAAAAVLVAAVVMLLGACGSSGHQPGSPQRTVSARGSSEAGQSRPPGASGTPAGPAGGSSATTEAAGSAANAAKVPDPRLTPPGGGTFTKQQKAYLSGRVPAGTDPVAVLEGGQEICDRLTRTAAVDQDAAASAILTGEISWSGATAAVHGLCPRRQPVLDAAAHGFGDGSFTVAARAVPGSSVAPGGYRAPHPSPSCTWQVTGAGGKALSSGPGTGSTPATARLTIPAAARGLTSSGCYAWLAS